MRIGQFLCAAVAAWCSLGPGWAEATPRDLEQAACLGTLTEAFRRPAWQLAYLQPELVAGCYNAPYRTMVRMKGPGNILVPVEELRARSRSPAEPSK